VATFKSLMEVCAIHDSKEIQQMDHVFRKPIKETSPRDFSKEALPTIGIIAPN